MFKSTETTYHALSRREKVWLEAWKAASLSGTPTIPWAAAAAAAWANECLSAFDKRFPVEPPSEQPSAVVAPYSLEEMPDDIAEAFEQFKLAILRHNADGWRQIAWKDVGEILDLLWGLVEDPKPSL